MRRLSVCLVALVALVAGCSARHVDFRNEGAPAGTGFLTKSFDFEGDRQNYTVFIPRDYTPTRPPYPVIMFLHGVLEGGSDGRKCVTVGLGPEVQKRRDTFPFIVVFPQSSSDWLGDKHARLAMATLDRVLQDYPNADPDRVILTGLSNGGDGTWAIGARHPDRFAALVPMCSGPDLDDAPRLTTIPIWAFHNSVDPFRSAGKVKEMCEKIKSLGGNVKHTQYGDIGHDCWTRAYGEGEVFTWMLAQRRAGAKSATRVP